MFLSCKRRRVRSVIDLTDDLSFTLQLLDGTHNWRHRLVEQETLGDGDHTTAVSAYQLEFPPALVAPYVADGHGLRVRALIPLTTKPKRPLLQFGIDGPGGAPAQLLLRSSIARIQGVYLEAARESSPAAPGLRDGLSLGLLEAICAFSPAVFDAFAADSDEGVAYRNYLEAGLGFEIRQREVDRWIDLQREAAAHLVDHLDEPPDTRSSAEQVLLAIPRLHESLTQPEDVDRVVTQYVRAIRRAERADDGYLLTALADYGRRWEVIVEVEVPLEEPFQIKLHEARPIELQGRGWLRESTPFALGDARSAHLEMRVDDPHVSIVGWEVKQPGSDQPVGVPNIEAVRYTRESFTLYSSDDTRPYYVNVALRLRVIRELRLANWFVGLLTLAAGGFVVVAPADEQLPETLALLTLPTTFAAALVLVRESSALAIRLQQLPRALIAALTVVLWGAALTRLAVHW